MSRPQPSDEWEFLPSDDDVGDGEELVARAAEAATLHIDAQPASTPTPESDADAGTDTTDAPRFFFEDEEPDDGSDRRASVDDRQPDLEEILESQHYAFGSDQPS